MVAVVADKDLQFCGETQNLTSKAFDIYFRNMGVFVRLSGRRVALSIAAFLLSTELFAQTEARVPELLIDDFSSSVPALGTQWDGFTDRVMGGRSDMRVGLEREDGYSYLSMTGNVSLANNGGFIQARLLLKADGRASFDASRYSGIRLTARGSGDGYYIFLRTTGNTMPWSFFMARLPVTEEWQEISIPWQSFKKGDFGSFFSLNTTRLTSLAVVAYKKAFNAALDVRRVSFY